MSRINDKISNSKPLPQVQVSSFHTIMDANIAPFLAVNIKLVHNQYSQIHVIFLQVWNRPYLRKFSKKCHVGKNV